jgi:sorting nexin-27
MAMPPEEAIRYESNCHSDDSSCNSNDFADRRALPVTIPDYTELRNSDGDKYIIFNVYMGGRHLCSRRYREFDVFNALVRREFPDFVFPNLPSKWPFKLSHQQLDARRRGLEVYLEKG